MNYNELLKEDIEIYKRIISDNEYFTNLKKICEIVNSLKITSQIAYLRYQIVLKQLNGYTYHEATFFNRIADKNYLNEIIEQSKIDTNVILFPFYQQKNKS